MDLFVFNLQYLLLMLDKYLLENMSETEVKNVVTKNDRKLSQTTANHQQTNTNHHKQLQTTSKRPQTTSKRPQTTSERPQTNMNHQQTTTIKTSTM